MGEFVTKRALGQTVTEATLQSNATTGDGTPVDLAGLGSRVTVYVKWNAGVLAGKILIETSDDLTFLGEWSKLHEFRSKNDAEDALQVDGPLFAVRARITQTVSGGATPGVTAKLIAHSP